MQNNMQLKSNLEMLERQTMNQMQSNLSEQQKQMMELKTHMKEANRKEEKDIDKYIAERDKEDYEKYLAANEERRRWQKNLMNQEYNNSIALKKAMQEHERLVDQNGNPLNTLKGVGDNYEMQLMKQRRVEDA